MEKISIPKPCHENWNAMTPEEKGRHCAVCNKVVFDFTQKSLPEIHEILIEKSEENICGRFNAQDVKPKRNWFQRKSEAFYHQVQQQYANRWMLGFAGLVLLLVGCKKKVETSSGTTGLILSPKSINSKKDSMNNMVMGESKCEKIDTIKEPKPITPPPIHNIKPPVIEEVPSRPIMGAPIPLKKDSVQ